MPSSTARRSRAIRLAAAEGVSAGCPVRVSGYGRSVPRVKALRTGCWTRRCGRGAIVKTRWWLLLLLLISVLVGWGGAAQARAAAPDPCWRERLTPRNVSARLDFDYHNRIYAQVTSNLTVTVPVDAWPLAEDLASSETSAEYKTAMRCLLRDDDEDPRNREWRYRDPLVTVRGGMVTVDYEATAWIEQARGFWLGPWKIEVDPKGEKWVVRLLPPRSLDHAKWGQVEVKLNGLEAHDVFPEVTSADPVRLVWSDPESVRVQVYVDPPWQRSFNVGERWWSLGWVGVASWWVFTSIVMVVGVWRAWREKGSRPSAESGPEGWEGLARMVRLWAVLSVVVALTLRLLLLDPPQPVPPWRYPVTLLLGAVLLLAARPWRRSGPSPAVGETGAAGLAGTRERRPGVIVAVAVIAAAAAVLGYLRVVPSRGDVVLPLSALATLWLWLAAVAAWAWCFAREGELLRRSWSRARDDAPVRWTVVAGALLAGVAAALLSSFWWTKDRNLRRSNWLVDPSGTARAEQQARFLEEFAYSALTWVYAYAWLLSGIALVALLNIRVKARRALADGKGEATSLGPAGADLLLTVAVFALAVGFRQVEFAGSNVLFGFWFLMMIGSLYAVAGIGRRYSVLGRTGPEFRRRRLGTKRSRHVLLAKAHEFRNVHHQLYLLDRGRGEGDLKRDDLERKLGGLQKWLFRGWDGEGPPPEQISVLDTALSWGPGKDWWDNARRAGRLAFGFGFPASVALVWLSYLRDGPTQMATFQSLVGIPEIVAKCLAWQVAWTGAGLVLGALWRVLPGRRSPVRALSLTAAYAVPVCVGALITEITDTELGYVFLHVALMLLVLTLTSIWMDMESFSEERRFWPSRVGLLLSVYQLRGLSTQVAYLAAQLAIVVGVWRSLAGSDSRPK
ncbi:DUF6185 family protein [Streptomyces sp. NBC_00158]|uniref:DUF6185 family protein n=1 Tax=Streptomyces sp. NBC_00158 TaxID=2903627 RepID=UPI00324565E7